MPEVAVAGTLHDADTAQLPQSTRPVLTSDRHCGWLCGSVTEGCTVVTSRAPRPP